MTNLTINTIKSAPISAASNKNITKITESNEVARPQIKELSNISYGKELVLMKPSFGKSIDFAAQLSQYKDQRGKSILSAQESRQLIQYCETAEKGQPIKNYQAKIQAVLSSPDELHNISLYRNKATKILRSIKKPLDSTVKAHPDAFADHLPSSDETRNFVLRLLDFSKNEKPFLSISEINQLIRECETAIDGKPIDNYKAKIEAVLNTPDEIYLIYIYPNKVNSILNAIKNPAEQTIRDNPEVFSDKLPNISGTEDFVRHLLGLKDSQKRPYLSINEIHKLVQTCQTGNDGKPIANYEAKIKAVLGSKDELLKLALFQNKATGILSAIKNPLEQTIRNNPEAFADRLPQFNESKDFIISLLKLKDDKGRPYLSIREIQKLMQGCQTGMNSKPIENYEAKIKAVLGSKDELLKLALFQNKANGILQAIKNPLPSTIKANPELYPGRKL